MPQRPDIIILNPDEMRWDALGHAGNPASRTPHLDAFAQNDAVSFRRAYCQNPVCVPSRCSFFTGLYPHVYGHRTMQYLQHPGESNLFRELKNAGYHVWMNSRNDLTAAQFPGLVEQQADEIYYGEPRSTAPRPAAVPSPAPAAGHDPFFYSHYRGHDKTTPDPDVQAAQAACRRILELPKDQPLCLFLGWMNPHPPYEVEQEYYDRIDPAAVPAPVRLEDCAGKARMIGRLHELVELDGYTAEQWRELRRVYLAQCAKIDDLFGMVCGALKQAGRYDASAIFVLSDHGDFCGDYGLPEKAQNCFEDCLTRVPLLIKPPKGQAVDPGQTDSLAELVDFYATAMDYAGVAPDHDHFGRSLRPVVENRAATVRQYVCCEGGRNPGETQCDEWHASGPAGPRPWRDEYWPKKTAQKDDLTHEKGTMICDGHYKYVERPSGANELYDLAADPQEKTNLYPAQAESPLVLRLRLALLGWYQTTCDTVPRPYDSRMTDEQLWRIAANWCPPEREAQVRAYIRAHPGVGINPLRMAVEKMLEEPLGIG